MKKSIVLALCGSMLLGTGASLQSVSYGSRVTKVPSGCVDITNIANPFISCKSIEEAEKLAGFEFVLGESLYNAYEKSEIQVIPNELIQVFYKKGNKEILVRKAPGNQDISGDTNVYDKTETISVNDFKVYARGNKGKINVVSWSKGDFSYSISSSGLGRDEMISLVEEVSTIPLECSGVIDPFKEVKTIKEAEKIAGFTFKVPEKIDNGYKIERIMAVDKSMIEVTYVKDGKEIVVKKVNSKDDLSEYYAEYGEKKVEKIKDLKFTTRSQKGKVMVATWINGDYSYSITTGLEGKGIELKDVKNIISNVK